MPGRFGLTVMNTALQCKPRRKGTIGDAEAQWKNQRSRCFSDLWLEILVNLDILGNLGIKNKESDYGFDCLVLPFSQACSLSE